LTNASVFTSVIDAGRRPAPPPPPGMRIPGRMVFSWYMVYHYTYSVYFPPVGDPTSIAAYVREIKEAQAGGVDGFILDYINRPDVYPTIYNIFAAAKQIHDADPTKAPFWLYVAPELGFGGSVQGNSASNGTGTNWILYFLQQFGNHPNYYKYNGKSVLGSFLGPDNLQNQSDLTNFVFNPMGGAGSVFYIATLFNGNNITTDGTHFTAWAQANLGSVNFWVGDLPAVDLANTNTFANICAVNGKPLVCEVQSGSYWSTNTSASQGIYFEHNGGEGSAQEWVNAIGLNPAWVTEAVWNDWTEAYTSPVDIPNVPTVSSGYPYDNLLKPHRGYSEQRKYYAQWYVTGAQPAIAKDLLIYFYRVCPQAANTNPCAGGGNPGPCPPDWRGTIQDVIFIETFLTAPATLSVSTGGNVTNYSQPAGLNFTRTNFTPGVQQFSLIRGGATIATVTGENILASVSQNTAEITTGFVYAA
jgi:glucan endo-1,3-alpha-glucosidase